MKELSNKLDSAANLAIIVVAILVGGLAVKQYLVPRSSSPPQIKSGQSVRIQGVDWSRSPMHLVLALSNTCHFCTESAPFYQRLSRYASRRSDLHVMAVLPQPAAAGAAYLRQLGVPIDEVREVPFPSIPVSGTPTLLLVDAQGKVRNVWMGKLPPQGEAEVMQQIGCKESCS